MKRILLFAISIFIFSYGQAQTSVFHEDFELVDSMSSSGNPTWFQQAGYFTSPSNCMRDTTVAVSPGVGDSSLLTTISFSTIGNFFISLNFNHICKINVADAGTVEVSNDNGTTWTQLTEAQRTSPSGGFATNVFNSATYGQTAAGWFPQIGNDTVPPTQSWWKAESFDISALTQNAANVKIRFKLKDRNGNGNQGNYGWLIDDVKVIAAVSELNPPRIVWAPPIVRGDQYFLGPFVISDTITDASLIDTAFLFYSVNGGSPITVGMSNTTGNIWQGTIPAMNDGDTVCYYVQAFDRSPNSNSALLPASGCVSFFVHSGIVFPYVDHFDNLSSPWTDSSGTGTNWQLGAPNFGVTNSTHSAPYAWDVNLNTAYTNKARCVLTSPVLNFTGVYNSKLSVWRNHNTEANYDGVHIEYSVNNGIAWKILGFVGDPLGTNWYTRGNASGPLDTIWDGNSNGWKLSTYRLMPLNNAGAQVKFRFVFMSDVSGIEDGFTIDDFAIELAPAIDAGVSSIVQTGNSAVAGTSVTVKVALTNFGSQPVSGFNVFYSIDGGTPVGQAYTGTLSPALNDSLTFTTPFTVPVGSYRICAYTVVTGDTVPSNDTICKNSQGVPLYGLPYTNNFDTGATNAWYDSSSAGTRWQLGTPNFGLTNSAFSAPNSWDINLNSAYGNNARAVLTSVLFDFTNQLNAKLSFWMNRNIASSDAVFLEYSIDNATTWNRMGIVNDPNAPGGNWYNNANINFTNLPGWDGNSGGWVKYSYILGPPFNNAGPFVWFRFVFTSNGTTTSDGVSIDDFAIIPASPIDIGIALINQPPSSAPAGASVNANVTIKNFGTSTITNADVAYVVNGALIATEPWTGSLAPSAVTNFTFATPFTVPAGQFSICAYTSLVTDSDHSNDTVCNQKNGIPLFTVPYTDNFDAGPVVWTETSVNPLTHWELGNPSFGLTTGSFSAPNCWDINLTTVYSTNARSYLVSPLFDFTNSYNAKLSFWRNHNVEDNYDGTRVEYTLDGGSSWLLLGIAPPDPNGINWYNFVNINSNPGPAFSGSTAGVWIKSEYKLGTVPGINNSPIPIQFRFVFTSDASVQDDGFSIDNFSIIPPAPFDVGAYSIVQPAASNIVGIQDTVKVVITNYGGQAATSFNVNYSINGGAPVSQLYTGLLAPASFDTVVFSTTFSIPPGTYNICAYTSLGADGDHLNDTTCKNSHGVPLLALPYYDNFDIGTVAYWIDSSGIAGTNWQFGTPNYLQTTGAFSAPNCWDINLNASYANNARSYLISPLFDFTGIFNAKLSFYQNYNTEGGYDGTRIDYSTDAGGSWQILGGIGDPLGTRWYNRTIFSSNQPAWAGQSVDSITLIPGWFQSTYKLVPLDNAGDEVMFRFVFTSDGSVNIAGASIDNFKIVPPSPIDASALVIIQPANPAPAGVSSVVRVIISNEGSSAISNFPVSYTINGVLSGTTTYTGTLLPAQQDTVTLPSFIFPTGNFNVCAFTDLPGDGDHLNDTTCKNSRGVPLLALPYYDNFDTGTFAYWIDSSGIAGTNWQFGTPNYLQTTGAFSAPNCWDINLNAAYANNARSYLISPLFDFTNIFNAKLSFFQNYNVENSYDGIRVDYSTNAGATWNVLGVQFDPLGTRWYNDSMITSSTFPGWTGVSIDSITGNPGWFQSTYKLVPLNNAGNQVMFRFVFTSDGSFNVAGASIDNIKIVPQSPVDASALVIVQPANLVPAGVSSVVRVVISNEGITAISNFPVSYTINGVLSGTTTYTGTLLPAQRDTVTLPSFIFQTGNFKVCAFTDLPGDGDQLNDTTCKNSFGLFTIVVPFTDNLEGAINFFSTTPSEWQFGVPNSTIINTAFSPTRAWKTKLIGNYSGNNNDNLYTPFFDFTGAFKPELRFWHWFETQPGAFGDGGRVEISTDGGVIWETLGSYQDAVATNWYTLPYLSISTEPAWAGSSSGYIESVYRLHQLDNWQGGLVQFRFNFTSNGLTNNNGWAIDNFEIFSPFPNVAPIELSPIINPFQGIANATQADSVKIFNRGSLNINSLDVSLIIDGVSIASDHINYSPALSPGTFRWHTFSTLWTPSPGGHHICAVTSNPNGGADINLADDNLCIYGGVFDSSRVTLSSFYCNDFEGGQPQLIPMNAYNYSLYTSDWELGTPDKFVINTTHSGSNAWITKLTGVYNSRDSSGLFSPVFAVDTAGCYELSFWHNFKTETFQDGGTVDYSNNGGVTWNRLGFAYEFNWYNSLYITGLPGPPTAGWSGNSNGWIYSAHFVRFGNTGHVLFRFRFGSDLTNEQDGWAIDDMCFKKVANCVIGIDELAGNTISLEQAYPNPASDAAIIAFSIPAHGKAKLYLTDILGRSINLLVNETLDAGIHRTELNVRNIADGLYYYTLEFDNQKMVRKLVVTH